MLIENLNQYTEEQIICLKNEDNQLRLLIKECPDGNKLKLLTDAVVNERTDVSLVIASDNNNLIASPGFECMSDNVSDVSLFNRKEVLSSIDGISIANMKRLQRFPLYHENLTTLLLQLPFEVLDNITPANLPNLKRIYVNWGSDKKNEMLLSRFKGFCKVGVW